MKILTVILTLTATIRCIAQPVSQPAPSADSGKAAFRVEMQKDKPDYRVAYRILSNQVKEKPYDAELHYFLGYAIDRMNSDDASNMPRMTAAKTIHASEQFEAVNQLTSPYTGEIILLDPYAKLTAIWGSLAQSYLTRDQTDSAMWAFSEGRRRGGFTEPFLEFNRQLINSCDPNAILITSGDMITIPIWYLQQIEGYRKDVTIVDGNMVHTAWYVKFLKHKNNLRIIYNDVTIDTIEYQQWATQAVTIPYEDTLRQGFSWDLRPTYQKKYLLKGDKILLHILQQNFYHRPIYFNSTADSTYHLHLDDYLRHEGLVTRVMDQKQSSAVEGAKVPAALFRYHINNIRQQDIAVSRDAVNLLNTFRQVYLQAIDRTARSGYYSQVKALATYMTQHFNPSLLPYYSTEMGIEVERYVDQVLKTVALQTGDQP